MFRPRLAAGIAALMLLTTPAAGAAARWGPTRTAVRSDAGVVRLVDAAALDNRRNVLLLVFENRGSGANQTSDVVAMRGRFGHPLARGRVVTTSYGNVQMASNDAGDVAVIASRLTQCPQGLFCDQDLWVTTGTVAGGLGQPLHLTSRLPAVVHATVAINHRGDVVVAWPDSSGGVEFTRGSIHGGFGATQSLPVQATSVSVGMDAAGDAALAWARTDATGSWAEASWIGARGGLGRIQTLAGGANQQHASGAVTVGPFVAVEPGGRALVAWSGRWRRGQTRGPTRLAVAAARGAFRRQAAGLPDLLTGLVAGARGGVSALFQPERGGSIRRAPRQGLAAAVADGARFGRPHVLSRSAGARAAVVDARGSAVFAWEVHGGLRVAVRPRAGSFGRSETLARGATQSLQLAANGRGDTLAAWSQGQRIAVRLRTH